MAETSEVTAQGVPPSGTPEPEATPVEDIATLKEALAQRDERLASLESQLQVREQEAERWRKELSLAVSSLRSQLLASAPEVPDELVQGQTAEEVAQSFARARQVVERVRGQLEARLARERVPAGAPLRSAPDLSALSPREKIAQALLRR